MRNIKSRWQGLSWEMKLLVTFGALALMPLFLALWSPPVVTTSDTPKQIDTHIPRGFVLIPIEIENYSALDSILGSYGIVDLFVPRADDSKSGRAVARNVRLVRAPHNPTHFAALVPESKSQEILSQSGSFVAVIKRPEAAGTEFVKEAPKVRRKISYGEG